MADYVCGKDGFDLTPALTRGLTFVKFRGHSSGDLYRDDTLTRVHAHSRKADDSEFRAKKTTTTTTAAATADDTRSRLTEAGSEEKEGGGGGVGGGGRLTGLALARLQHRAKKSSAQEQERPRERRGSNPDRPRLTIEEMTSSSKVDVTSSSSAAREEPSRPMERPTSSWASKSGRRPRFTESGWNVEDEAFVLTDTRPDNNRMPVHGNNNNEPNTYSVRRASVNDTAGNSHRVGGGGGGGAGAGGGVGGGGGTKDKLTRRASDSWRAKNYREMAKELRRDGLIGGGGGAGSLGKKEDVILHANGCSPSSSCSSGGLSPMTSDGELARLRAVSRLGSQTAVQPPTESPSMASLPHRALPRKLDPIPSAQMVDRTLDEAEEGEEKEEGQETTRHVIIIRRGSRELDHVNFSPRGEQDSIERNNINARQILKPIPRK